MSIARIGLAVALLLAWGGAAEAKDALLASAQTIIAEDSPVAFLFQLAKHGVWDAKVQGLWENSPVRANDLTGVSWAE